MNINLGAQRGSAGVELAMILALTFFILPVTFLFGRIFYHYSVVNQATHDAALYIAGLSPIEKSTSAGLNAAKTQATQMVFEAIAAAGIRPPEDLQVLVHCDGGVCAPSLTPAEYEVQASFRMYDGMSNYTYRWLPDSDGFGWTFIASATVRNSN